MKNYDQTVKINHNPNWRYVVDHTYRILIIDVQDLLCESINYSLTEEEKQELKH